MNAAVKNAAVGVAGMGTAAIATLALRRLRRGKPATAAVTLDVAPGERGVEMRMVSYDISKERLKALLREFKAEVEAGEVPTGKRSA